MQKTTALAVEECEEDNPPKLLAQEGASADFAGEMEPHGLARGAPFQV